MSADPTIEPLAFDVESLTRVLPLGRTTLYQLIARGELPSFKVGRRRLIARSAVEQFLAGGGAK